MAERREAQWSARDVVITAGVGTVLVIVVAVGLTRSALHKRRVCNDYLTDFQRELDEGRLKYAGITEKLAREAGCSWPTKWADRPYG